jgi:surface antigen
MRNIALLCLFLASLVSGNASAFDYTGNMTFNGHTYTDYFIVKTWEGPLYTGVFYDSACYGSDHVVPAGQGSGQFKPQCGDRAWYATSCNVSMTSCGYQGEFSPAYEAYINSVFLYDYGTMTYAATTTTYSDWATTRDIYASSGSQAVILESTVIPQAQLTIVVEPSEGGSVTGSGISCNVDEYSTCTYTLSEVSEDSLIATADEGYAFGFWTETKNPRPMTPNGDTTITAKFFKTFRNAVTDPEGFRKEIDDTTGGQCVNYVRDETDVVNTCTGYAVNCLGQAKKAGYQTGDTPKIGAIAVFSATSTLPYGHVGIVKLIDGNTIRIRESNWCSPATCETVGEHDENLSLGRILGYIYTTP